MLSIIRDFFSTRINPKPGDDNPPWTDMVIGAGATLTIDGDVRTTRITCMEGSSLIINGTLDLSNADSRAICRVNIPINKGGIPNDKRAIC